MVQILKSEVGEREGNTKMRGVWVKKQFNYRVLINKNCVDQVTVEVAWETGC